MDGYKILNILQKHQEWLDSGGKKGKKANFRYADLSFANLEDVDLSRVNLEGVNLKSANLYKVNLIEANLFYASLDKANLEQANLSNVNLRNASLHSANLKNANFEGSILIQSCLSFADMSNANLTRSILSKSFLINTILMNAVLYKASLNNAILKSTNFSNTQLQNANFSYAEIIESDFSNSNLNKTDLRYSKLINTNFQCAEIKDANFSYINIDTSTAENIPIEIKNKYFQTWNIIDSEGNPIIDNQIIIESELRPEYFKLGMLIITSLGKILQNKYSENILGFTIKEAGIKVTVIIEINNEYRNSIEETIYRYGQVIIGKMYPEELVSDKNQISELKILLGDIADFTRKNNEMLNSINDILIPKPKETFLLGPSVDKGFARIWTNDTEPEGKALSIMDENNLKNKKSHYNLFILRDETSTNIYINGEKTKTIGGKIIYRILSYVLKHKGTGGTAWNIAKHVWSNEELIKYGDLREISKALKYHDNIEKGKAQELADNYKDVVSKYSKLISRRIIDLNEFLKLLNTKLEANELDEYEFNEPISYCLIEKIKVT